MKNLRVPVIALCLICVASITNANDVQFGDWTVSINAAPTSDAAAADVKREIIIREVHETRHVQTHTSYPHFRQPYYGYGSNYSIYFPWRNYRGAGFTSYYRPRTIYNYGY